MTKHEEDALARAVATRRAATLARLDEEMADELEDAEEEAAQREANDRLRAELAGLARIADPVLHAWVRSERFELALRAYPGSLRRAVELPALHILAGSTPRFADEPGPHQRSRSRKLYVVSIGETLELTWSAGGIGGGGGGMLPIQPRSFAALAAMDLTRALGPSAPWQEPDVLRVATRVASIVAAGQLEGLVVRAMHR